MTAILITLYLLTSVTAIAFAILLGLQAFENRRYAKSCLRNMKNHRPVGHAALLVPCKGMDVDLESNLRAFLVQDYGDYEVHFIVESEDDPACETIERVAAEHPDVRIRLVVAGRAIHTGQKVHNLRAATSALPSSVEVIVFADSDACPRPEWLRAMAAGLAEEKNGAVTGYRWFIPERPSLANSLLYGINCRVASLMGRDNHHLIWGGSWAIRREVFERIDLNEAWKGTLSDDLVAGKALRRAKLRVRFEPACMAASPCDGSLAEMFEFVRRQYMVGKFYAARWWGGALLLTTICSLFWPVAAIAAWVGFAAGSAWGWISAASMAVVYLLSVVRNAIVQDLALAYFPEKQEQLSAARRFDIWAGPLVGFVNWLGLAASAYGQHIRWRNIVYRIYFGGQIRIERREDKPQRDEHPTTIRIPETGTYRKAG